jgi:hypothetical protein
MICNSCSNNAAAQNVPTKCKINITHLSLSPLNKTKALSVSARFYWLAEIRMTSKYSRQ